jgi:hypothetical protein
VRFPAEAVKGYFSLRYRVQTGAGPHPASYPMNTGGSLARGKAADHSPPSSAEVKTAWSCTSILAIYLHDVALELDLALVGCPAACSGYAQLRSWTPSLSATCRGAMPL